MPAASNLKSTNEKSFDFQLGANIIKENPKDIFRLIKTSLDWIRLIFSSLKDSFALKNLFRIAKGGEDGITLNEFGESVFNIAHSITIGIKKGIINSIELIGKAVLDLNWQIFKLLKLLSKFEVVTFTSKVIINLSVFGGISFAISQADKVLTIAEDISKLETYPNLEKKEVKILYSLCKLAKNIGLYAIGTITALSAIFAAELATIYWLLIGTTILISSFAANIIEKTNPEVKNIKNDIKFPPIPIRIKKFRY